MTGGFSPRLEEWRHEKAETFSKADCLTVIGWYEKALQMFGAVNPRVFQEECRARGSVVCRYTVSWQWYRLETH